MSTWRDRERRRPKRMSDRLRRDTERPWEQDPCLSNANGGPGYDGCPDHGDDVGDREYGDQDDGPEVIV